MKRIVLVLLLLGSLPARAEIIAQELVQAGYQGTLTASLAPGFAPIQPPNPDVVAAYGYQGDPNCTIIFGKISTGAQIYSTSLRDEWLNGMRQVATKFPGAAIYQPQFGSNQGGTSFYIGQAMLNSPSGAVPFVRITAQGNRGGRAIGQFFCGVPALVNQSFAAAVQTLEPMTIAIDATTGGGGAGQLHMPSLENGNRLNQLFQSGESSFFSRQRTW